METNLASKDSHWVFVNEVRTHTMMSIITHSSHICFLEGCNIDSAEANELVLGTQLTGSGHVQLGNPFQRHRLDFVAHSVFPQDGQIINGSPSHRQQTTFHKAPPKSWSVRFACGCCSRAGRLTDPRRLAHTNPHSPSLRVTSRVRPSSLPPTSLSHSLFHQTLFSSRPGSQSFQAPL